MHLRVNEHGLPLQIELSPGQAHDAPMAELLLQDLPKGTSLLADRGYDADWIREMIEDQNCTPVIPPKSNRREEIPFSKRKYKKRNLVERCINKLKQFRHIATRYDRYASAYLAFAKLGAIRLWLRFYESAAYVGDPTKYLTILTDFVRIWVWATGRKTCATCSGCRMTPGRLWSRIFRITNLASPVSTTGG
jgi:transposase